MKANAEGQVAVSLIRKFRTTARIVRNHGFGELLSHARRLVQQNLHPVEPAPLADVLGTYSFCCNETTATTSSGVEFITHGETRSDSSTQDALDPDTINWVVPDFGFGSGGHLNIFRMVHFLEELGFKNHITMISTRDGATPDVVKGRICEYFAP